MTSAPALSLIVRELWRYAVPTLRPNERMQLFDEEMPVCIEDTTDAYRIRAFRFFADADGLIVRRSYRVACVDITGPQIRSWSRLTKSEIVDDIRDALRVLVGRLRDRLPEGWRLFGRRAPAVKRSRIRGAR